MIVFQIILGIGGIRDIFHGVRHGIDTFDCVHPTRLGKILYNIFLFSYINVFIITG